MKTHHLQIILLASCILCLFGLTFYRGVPSGAYLLMYVGMMSALLLVFVVRWENDEEL